MDVAPEIWLGYIGDSGLGARARWWYFREDTSQSAPLSRPGGGILTVFSAAPLGAFLIEDNAAAFQATSKLQVQVWDFEAIQDTTLCNWDLLFSGGLRLVDITQNYNAFAIRGSGAAAPPILSGSSLTGVGPVVGLEARRPLSDSGLSLYGSARASLLFGSSKQNAAGGDEANGLLQAHEDQVLSIEELELGVEFGQKVGHSRVFGQVAMVGQEWFGAGNATHSVTTSAPTTAPVFSTADSSNLGFFGVVFRLGVNY